MGNEKSFFSFTAEKAGGEESCWRREIDETVTGNWICRRSRPEIDLPHATQFRKFAKAATLDEIHTQLKAGYRANAERDLALAAEWSR